MFKKIFYILGIFLIIGLFIVSSSFALTFDGLDGKTYLVSDDIILKNVFAYEENNMIFIFTFSGDYSCGGLDSGGNVLIGMDCSSSGFYRKIHISTSSGLVNYSNDFKSSSVVKFGVDKSKLVYINFDVVDFDGNIVINKTSPSDIFELNLTVEPSGLTTNVPILIHTQSISTDSILKYNLEYSLDNNDWFNCNTRSINDLNGNTVHQFYYEAYKNEIIYFRFQNIETGEYLYDSVSIDNIIINQDNYDNYIDGVFKPTPFLTYEYINDTLITVKTQKFFEEEIRKLECSYIKYTTEEDYNNEELWTNVEIRSVYDMLTKQTMFEFYFDIDNSNYTADGDYFVRFYNKETEEYTVASLKVSFQSIIDYQQSLNEVNSKLDVFIDFFKERFGFLTYPFELIVEVLQRFLYIEFEEPILRIPDINEPFTGVKLISATEFNFNDMLENETLKSVHDIYLVFVDAIIILGLVNLCRIKLMGVFVK